MTERTATRLAWGIWSACILCVVLGTIAGIVNPSSDGGPGGWAPTVTTIMFLLAFSTVGAVVASRRRENPIGWLLLASGACFALGGLVVTVDNTSTNVWAQWVSGWVWGAGAFLALAFPFLLFPDGHLPSRRWRIVAWIGAIGVGGFIFIGMFAPGRIADTQLQNPVGLELFGLGKALLTLRAVVTVMSLVACLLAIVSLGFRYHRAGRVEREQLRWLLFAAGVVVLAIVAQGAVTSLIKDEALALNIGNAIIAGSLSVIPIAIGVAVLKYHLYDIDIVISKTLVYGALAAFITLVYVAIVVGVGSLVGRGGQPDVVLSIAATAVVAVAFQPVRERVQRFANRLVYGKRATPYEVLAEFSERMAGTYANEDLLPRMARILAEGTGAARADVWLRADGRLYVDASWPIDAELLRTVDADPLPGNVTPVHHQGELLGALSIEKKPGESLTPTEQKLIDDLASQAGLVLRNVGLTEQLLARLEELKASRQRLVAAQDEERRKIERNIHDGAQQQLVALSVKQRLAASFVGKNDDRVREMLEQLQADTNAALDDLRDLARGIYPPLLADKGLPAALEAQARKAVVPTSVSADGIGRFPQDVESAVYFSVLEALQNVAKYAGASQARVTLSNADGRLRFSVTDDGAGFDPSSTGYGTGLQGIADRLAVIGGELEVSSSPGTGTRVAGWLPTGSDPA